MKGASLRIRATAVRCLCGMAALIASAAAASAQMALPGSASVAPGGVAVYSIPIAAPPGTADVVPSLTLDYNSGAGDGVLGIGWSLGGLPSVSRCARTLAQDGVRGAVNYDANDRFCLEGQRLIAINGTDGADGTEYRTEIDSFNRVISHGTAGTGPAWFEVHTKSGHVMQLGDTADSQVLAQGKTTARAWAVNKISDSKGNYFTVTYAPDTANGQAYPQRIDYTGNTAAGVSPYDSVQFFYATRPDVDPLYHVGSLFQIAQRLTEIKTFDGSNEVADYKLAYQQSPGSSRSELTSVTLCGSDGTCLPATTFAWTTAGSGPFAQSSQTVDGSFGSPPDSAWTPISGDFNGDGRTDFAFVAGNGIVTFIGKGDGTFVQDGQTFSTDFNSPPTSVWTPFVGDFNGDGNSDFAFVSATTLWTFLSKGNGTFTAASHTLSTNFGAPPTATWTPLVGDFDGDGRTDFAFVSGTTISTFLSNGDGTFRNVGQTFSGTLGAPPTSWTPVSGDFNGDGKTDFAFVSGTTIRTFTSNGDGTFTAGTQTFTGSLGAPPTTNWTPIGGDFNGDGNSDFAFVSGTSITTFLSKGDGTFSNVAQTFTGSLGAPPTSAWTPISGDFNGDGKSDFAFAGGTTIFTFMSNGNGNFTKSSQTISPSLGSPPTTSKTLLTGDFNGDGQSDFVFLGGSSTTTFLATGALDLMTSVTSSLGATTTFTYQPLTNASVYTKGTTSIYPLVDFAGPIYVVARMDTSNGVGGIYSSTYQYSALQIDLTGRGPLGFASRSATDLQTNVVETDYFSQLFPFTGQMAAEMVTLTSGSVLSQAATTYGATNAGGTRSQVFVSKTVGNSFDLDGSVLPALTTTYQYDGFGNATQVVVSTPDGATKTTTNTYTNDTTNWFLGRLTNATVTSTLP
jgi:hypothetical protein